ncbi:hypothetical protein Taro_053623 [Colocasia esculenta]|uniref:Uncharacterized protein n=1 Tax=Colocasia esculenta TaxID=4460 RepID=A0A843XLR5_COLES|nr:hypothetical protein [Colocasia esculenta]
MEFARGRAAMAMEFASAPNGTEEEWTVVFARGTVTCTGMALDGGSYSGSRPWRQRTTVQQTFPTHSASEGSVAASSMVSSTTSIAGPVFTQTWGRGHGRRGPSRGLTDRRLEFGQQWNVKVIGGTGESGAQFVSHMGIVSKLQCKIWQKYFVKLPADIIDTIFSDLEHYTGKSFDDAIVSVPAGVNLQDWQIMCAKWNTLDERNIADRNKANRSHQSMPYRKGRKSHYQLKDDFEKMIQLSTPSLDSESGSTPISAEEAFVSVMGKDRSSRIHCGGNRETRHT